MPFWPLVPPVTAIIFPLWNLNYCHNHPVATTCVMILFTKLVGLNLTWIWKCMCSVWKFFFLACSWLSESSNRAFLNKKVLLVILMALATTSFKVSGISSWRFFHHERLCFFPHLEGINILIILEDITSTGGLYFTSIFISIDISHK